MLNQRGSTPLIVIVGILILVILSGVYWSRMNNTADVQIQSETSQTPVRPISVQERNPSNVDNSDWKTYSDNKYMFNYPTDWYIADDQQVQNWNPLASRRPAPLGEGDAKWDLSFTEQKASSFEDIIKKESLQNFDLIESSKTKNGWNIYFAYQKESEPLNTPYLVMIAEVPNKNFIVWHGYASNNSDSNIETLKEIAESLQLKN